MCSEIKENQKNNIKVLQEEGEIPRKMHFKKPSNVCNYYAFNIIIFKVKRTHFIVNTKYE